MSALLYPVSYRAEHVRTMDLQPAQIWMESGVDLDRLRSLENVHAYTLMEDGQPLACGGAIPLHAGRAYLWAYLSSRIDAPLFHRVHGWAKSFIRGLPFRRLEATVDAEFVPGQRWVRALGFVCETPKPIQAFTVLGRSAMQYALVRTWQS